ncbi:hypothetical protein F5877DRAFT_90909 [Lentinula edodes]|nr:hypothetical protein F5877DRAFT_90909 [Lentinula edodes]
MNVDEPGHSDEAPTLGHEVGDLEVIYHADPQPAYTFALPGRHEVGVYYVIYKSIYKTNAEALTAKEWFVKTFVNSSKISVKIVEGVKDGPKPRPNKRPRIDNASVEDLDESFEVMQTKKGASWANGVSPEAFTSATNLDDLPLLAEDEPPAQEETTDTEQVKIEEFKGPAQDVIFQTSRLFVRNLAFSCSDSDLTTLFGQFGEFSQVDIHVDLSTRRPKGLAYVAFAKVADDVSVYEVLDKTAFQGLMVHILPAVDRKGKFEVKEGEGAKRSVKDENNAQCKTMAGKEFNCSMLYINSHAVASSSADHMNISKADILNPDSDELSSSTNPAVKLAFAETHILNETKAYLESNGVVLVSFSSSGTVRADTTILVKNICYGTSDIEIRELFEPHGTVSRVLVSPAGTIAVVEFEKPDKASRGFRAVAPIGIFTDALPRSASYSASPGAISVYADKLREQTAEAMNEGDEAPSFDARTTLFVNIEVFSNATERLKQMFRNCPSVAVARDVDGARKVMKSMQAFVLDGDALYIKFSGRGDDEDVDQGKDGVSWNSRTMKLIVKNVPFEATKKVIRHLFGYLKSVRLSKTFDSRTDGFAFVDSVSRQQAENAYAALRHTQLSGRHLVLEWAEEAGQDLEMLRKKASLALVLLDMSITGENEEEDEDE